MQDLDPVFAVIQKDEYIPAERAHHKLVENDAAKTIEALTHIGGVAIDVIPEAFTERYDHFSSADKYDASTRWQIFNITPPGKISCANADASSRTVTGTNEEREFALGSGLSFQQTNV